MSVVINSAIFWSDWPFQNDATFEVRAKSTRDWISAESEVVAAGQSRVVGTGTISSLRPTIPAITLPATSAGLDDQTARWTVTLHRTGKPQVVATVLADFPLPVSYEPSTTWAQIKINKNGKQPLRDTSVYTKTEVNNLLQNQQFANPATSVTRGVLKVSVDAADPVAVETNDRRIGDFYNIKAYGASTANTAAANATAIAAAATAAALTGGGIYVPVGTFNTNNVTISVPIQFAPGASILNVTTGHTVYITKSLIADVSKHFGNATAGLGSISFSGNISLGDIYPQWFGAVPDGITDCRAAAQAGLDAIATAGGGLMRFVEGTYLVTGSLRPPSNTTIAGDGYGSQIKCPSAGWTVVAVTNMGIVNVDNKDKVRITGLRITGTKSATTGTTTPKLIYLEGTGGGSDLDGIMIDHCWFDNTIDEGIWEGGVQGSTLRLFITNNYFFDIGYHATAYNDPCAIQLNVEEAVIANNMFRQVGTAIAGSGQRMVFTGNHVRDLSGIGITVGDGPTVGIISVSGNTIDFTESTTGNPRLGIRVSLSNTTENHMVNVAGNVVRGIGTAARGALACYTVPGNASATLNVNAQFVGNTAEIQVRGTGFSIEGAAGSGHVVSLSSNTVRLLAESGQSYGFSAAPGTAGRTTTIYSSNNRALGFSTGQSSYAFYYVTTGGGTLNGFCQGDYASGGYIGIGDTIYNNTAGTEISVPFSENASLTQFSSHFRYAQVSTLNLMPSVGTATIASGVITISGIDSGTSYPKKQTQVKVDTEASAATDDLDTINGTLAGDILILRSADSGRDVVVKNATGNIFCGTDFTLATTRDRILLISDGTNLYKIGASTN